MEYRVNKQAVEKKPATILPHLPEGGIEELLFSEQYLMELLLVYEVNEWEELYWQKLKSFLDQIGNDRVEEKERLTREWRADCWRRLNSQMHAAVKRWANFYNMIDKDYFLGILRDEWASSISLFCEGVEKPYPLLVFIESWGEINDLNDEIRQRMEKEIEDTKFRLKRGSDLGRFDQFWDDSSLFGCRYSRSKWVFLTQFLSNTPLEILSHALKGNKNIIHINFSDMNSDFDVDHFLCDLPWVTSISFRPQSTLSSIHHDLLLFIKSANLKNDLITFAKEIRHKLDLFSTYIFTDAGVSDMMFLDERLCNNARVLISFVAPTSGQSLILRLKHSGEENGPLEVTLGPTIIQFNPSSKSSLKIDDISLYSTIQVPSPSGSDCLSFEPGIRNDVVIQFRGTVKRHGHYLHDIELLDEAGLEYMPLVRSAN